MEFRLYREFFQALGNPTRFRIVQLLREGPRSVGQIAESLGYEQSRVSHGLACLLNCGFLVWNWEGKNRIYRLHRELASILASVDRHLVRYAPQLDTCQVLGHEGHETPAVALVGAGRTERVRSPSIRRPNANNRLRRKQ